MRTKNKIWIALGLLLLACIALPAQAVDLEKKIVKARLQNGLTVLMMERKFSPTVSLYIRYRVGAVDESPGQSGAAHFLEHMMFKGTTTIGAKKTAFGHGKNRPGTGPRARKAGIGRCPEDPAAGSADEKAPGQAPPVLHPQRN